MMWSGHHDIYAVSILINFLVGVMVSELTSYVEGCGFDPWPGQTKDIKKFGICCFSTKYALFRSKSNDWSAQSLNDVSG